MSRLAVAGIIAPVWFVTMVIVQGFMHPDYSQIALPISAYAAWPNGWMQNLTFFVTSPLLALFAVGLHNAIQPTRYGLVGVILLLLPSIGMVIAGLFPWISVNGVPTATRPHALGGVLTFTTASAGMVLISRRMATDANWRDLATYVLVTGIVMVVLFLMTGALAIDENAPLHAYFGLLQRLFVIAWFACMIVMARRALQIARTGST
jgi:hypothetical membrane protein